MSITEVKIHRISDEEKYYRQRADQSEADYADVEEQYTWKRTRRIVVYNDRGMPSSPSLWEIEGEPDINEFTSRSREKNWDDAFNAARADARAEMSRLGRNAPISWQGGVITFEVYMGGVSAIPRGRIVIPNLTPPRLETYWEYKYEILKVTK